MVSNNNSQGSESPLPSPRFSRYIRTPASSDNTDSNSRPSSATTSTTSYSPRVGGKICSQPPNASLGKNKKIFKFIFWGIIFFKKRTLKTCDVILRILSLFYCVNNATSTYMCICIANTAFIYVVNIFCVFSFYIPN